jgi:pimeloyl-ACP methyl ester carboxylesterase
VNSDRRQLLAMATGAAIAAVASSADSEPQLAPLQRSVTTSVLEIGYLEFGGASGFPVLLLHGFPDDAHAYDAVALALAKKGYRALSPYLRGFGPTRFLDPSAPRMAEQAAIGRDVIDFADALNLNQFAVCGYDWGGRAACIAAALNPDRVRAAVLMGGYTVQDTITPGPPAPPAALKRAWYQWYFNTEVGRRGLEQNRRSLCRFMWQDWSPTWHFSDADFELTAQSFENSDFVDCVMHSYRHRTFNAPGEARFLEAERKLALHPKIEVPSILLYGGDSGFGRPESATIQKERALFTRLVGQRIVEGAGHFVPRESPEAVVSAMLEVLEYSPTTSRHT